MALTVAARATITINFEVNNNWPETCTMADIEKDAKAEALDKVKHALSVDKIPVQFIGEPRINVILVQSNI